MGLVTKSVKRFYCVTNKIFFRSSRSELICKIQKEIPTTGSFFRKTALPAQVNLSLPSCPSEINGKYKHNVTRRLPQIYYGFCKQA